jgi:hypothetical protein
MTDLTIRIKKKADGSAALSCERRDGTVTWQRQDGAHGQFFPLHDLTHFAVETTLGHRRGFYGLLAEGWDIGDFGTPWPRGPMPLDAEPSELIVGFLDMERASGATWSADELNERLSTYGAHTVTDEQVATIRTLRNSLFAQWTGLAPGSTLELPFSRSQARA